jgi:hypothetical protein
MEISSRCFRGLEFIFLNCIFEKIEVDSYRNSLSSSDLFRENKSNKIFQKQNQPNMFEKK